MRKKVEKHWKLKQTHMIQLRMQKFEPTGNNEWNQMHLLLQFMRLKYAGHNLIIVAVRVC